VLQDVTNAPRAGIVFHDYRVSHGPHLVSE
jgi:hypothetical protein